MSAITRVSIFIFLIFIFLCPKPTFAVAINPTASDVTVNSGSSSSVLFAVGNDQGDAVTFHFDVILATFSGKAESPKLSQLPSEFSSWIDVEPDVATIAPGTFQEVSMKISPPKDFPDQVIVLGLRAVGDEVGGSGVRVREGVIGLSFVTIGSDGTAIGSLVDFALADRDFYQSEVTFYTTIKNTGSTILKPTGTIKIQNALSRTVEVLEINIDGNRINPGQTRTFSTHWNPSFNVGIYWAGLRLDSSSSVTGIDSEIFYLFPLWFIVGLSLLLILVLILVRLVWKKRA